MNPSTRRALPWLYIGLLTALLGITFLGATPQPNDDFYFYQKFIESLAHFKLDLTIPGFHGTDIFGLVVYAITQSPLSQIHGLIIAALLLPLVSFVTGRTLFKSTTQGLVLATIVTMMPFISFVCLRGWTGPGYWLWMLLSIYAAATKRWWVGIPFALAILSKPFAIVLLPLLIVLLKDQQEPSVLAYLNPKNWIRLKNDAGDPRETLPLLATLFIVALYFLIQIAQAGHLIIGAHPDMSVGGALQDPTRFVLNLAHSLQILFSVHNYYFPDPALTGAGNLMHTSPVLIFLGLFGLLAPRDFWKDRHLHIPRALLLGAVLGIVMNALLDHMDHFYMEASILLLILGSLPVLLRYRLWMFIALATLHFQWFYFYLQFKDGFGLGFSFFLVPAVVDVCFALWSLRISFSRASLKDLA